MLPDAFEFERAHERISEPVLLGGMRENELLLETVGLREITIELGGIHQRVFRAPHDVGIALG